MASLDILKIQGQEVIFNVHLLATEDDFEQEVLRIAQVQKGKEEVPQPSVEDAMVEPELSVTEPQNPAVETAQPSDVNAVVGDGMSQPSEQPVITEQVPVAKTLRFTWLD